MPEKTTMSDIFSNLKFQHRLNGQLHREDGPAIEWTNGEMYWYINGIIFYDKEFKNAKEYKDFLLLTNYVKCHAA
jgi:hypothetical protein